MEGEVYVTAHAAERWQERVERVTRTEATIALVRMWRAGHHVENPPKWLRRTRSYTPGRGLLLVMSDDVPGVALIVDPEGELPRVVTVLDRKSARAYCEARDLARPADGQVDGGFAGKRKAGKLVRRARLEQEDDDGWEGGLEWRR
jgi:hypothetical protein